MQTKAILFDKDGTLIDFEKIWVNVSRYAVKEILKKFNMECVPEERMLEALGIYDGTAAIDGVLAQYPYDIMGKALYDALEAYGCKSSLEEIIGYTEKAYCDNLDKGVVEPICENLREVLVSFKSRGIKLFVVTNDYTSATREILEKAHIYDLFDDVYTVDRGLPHKPDPTVIYDICKKYSFDGHELCMVGDTLADMQFAKNGGIKGIGVARNERNRMLISAVADEVIYDISTLDGVID